MERNRIFNYLIALTWFVNGLICKILNLVPRHQEIVERILENNQSRIITIVIGIAEILMALWVLSNYKSKINAVTQIIIVATLNIIEFVLAPDLLLWGTYNSLFALLFILLIFYTNFKLKKQHDILS